MAVKKPLVISSGRVEQLQSGDVITGDAEVEDLTNNTAGSITIGQAVYIDANDSVQLAQANGMSTAKVYGLVFDTSISASGTGKVQVDGVVEASTAEWDAVTGGSGGLTAGSEYYLSASSAGGLTTTAPTAAGQVVAPVGVAQSTTKLALNVKTPVLL